MWPSLNPTLKSPELSSLLPMQDTIEENFHDINFSKDESCIGLYTSMESERDTIINSRNSLEFKEDTLMTATEEGHSDNLHEP